MNNNYILLTGATGLLGQYLLRDLMAEGHRVAVVIRGKSPEAARQRLEQVMQFWEGDAAEPLSRPVCLRGDITQTRLGLDPQDIQWVQERVDRVFHCAASLTFHTQGEEPRRTNVQGTQNVVDFCELTGVDDVHYVSTAYVCGRREDVVLEDELDVGQEFRNDYERSKFDAEKIVRESPAFRQRTIYRPVVITGDSVTGYTSTYHGTYLYMKLASVLSRNIDPDEHGNRHVPIRWGATGNERRNITPVDWNSNVICQLFNNPHAHGHTFHLAPEQPIAMRQVIEYAARYFHLTGIEFHGYHDKPDFKLNELERWIWSNIKIYGAYDFMDARFDITNLKKFAPQPPSPPIDYPMAERLMRYAEADRWGKRKPPALEPAPCDSLETLRQYHEQAELAEHGDGCLGLDVIGPGGGQYSLFLDEDQCVGFAHGLPADARVGIVQITSQQLAHLAGRPKWVSQLRSPDSVRQPAAQSVGTGANSCGTR